MSTERSKRQKRCKRFALIDFEDNTDSIIETKLITDGNIAINSEIFVTWPEKGKFRGLIVGLSDHYANLATAKAKKLGNYTSDDDCNNQEDVTPATKTKHKVPDTRRAKGVKKPATTVDVSNWTFGIPVVDQSDASNQSIGSLNSALVGAIQTAHGLISAKTGTNLESTVHPEVVQKSNDNMEQKIYTQLEMLNNTLINTVVPLLQTIAHNAASFIPTAMPESFNFYGPNNRNVTVSSADEAQNDNNLDGDAEINETMNEVEIPPLSSTRDNSVVSENVAENECLQDAFISNYADVPLEKYMNQKQIDIVQRNAKSRSNFAQILVNNVFSNEERLGATISGANGYRKLDAERIEWVIKVTFMKYPLDSRKDKGSVEWSSIRNNIDCHLRRVARSKNKENRTA